MSQKKIIFSLCIIFFLAIIGWACWLFEIICVRKWYSLSWLGGALYLPYFGTLVAAIAFIVPFKLSGVPIKKLLLPVLFLYFVSAFCYEVGRQLCLALYCRVCMWQTKELLIIFLFAFLVFALIGFFYWLITSKMIKRIKKINSIYISLLLVLGIILSMLSIHLNTGFGHETGWVDCVKMGYPVFWTILILGLCGLMISKQKEIA